MGGVKKSLRNTNGGSWQMLTFDDKGGWGGPKNPKTCLRNTWMFPKSKVVRNVTVTENKEQVHCFVDIFFQKLSLFEFWTSEITISRELGVCIECTHCYTTYRISSYSFHGNYSFLNLTLCTVTFGHSTYRWGNYSREETIQGRKLFKGGNYSWKYGMSAFWLVKK